jgi:vacuolar-type H+-ATPase subunit C/Vma6
LRTYVEEGTTIYTDKYCYKNKKILVACKILGKQPEKTTNKINVNNE